jgi:predicted phosphodiesterase
MGRDQLKVTRKPTIKGECALKYLRAHPTMPRRSLAAKMQAENPLIFENTEKAYKIIRYWTGKNGNRDREKNLGHPFFTITPEQETELQENIKKSMNQFPVGTVTLEDWGTFKILGTRNVLIISDLHIPFHNKRAIELMLDFVATSLPKVDTIIINGDLLDHYSISRWLKNPQLRDFPNEVKLGRLFLKMLRELFPDAEIYYKEGNHEERYVHFMRMEAADLLGIEDFSFENVYRLKELNITYITGKKPIKLNELFIIHGHEYRFAISNPVNPARGLFLRAGANALTSHFHQSSSHSQGNIDDKSIGCWSIGHLADPHPEYMPLNKWNFGFAFVQTTGEKRFQVHNFKIIKEEVFLV